MRAETERKQCGQRCLYSIKLVGLLSIHTEHITRALPLSMALEASISFLRFQGILAPVIAHEPAEHPATGVLSSINVLDHQIDPAPRALFRYAPELRDLEQVIDERRPVTEVPGLQAFNRAIICVDMMYAPLWPEDRTLRPDHGTAEVRPFAVVLRDGRPFIRE
jgi:hypothetical protein